MKEFFRKRIVALKRSPQIIPLILLIISSCIFLFGLKNHSYASINNINPSDPVEFADKIDLVYSAPGLYLFLTSLFAILCVISYLSVYKGGKTNRVMLGIVLFMLVLMIVSDILYINSLKYLTGEFLVIKGVPADQRTVPEAVVKSISNTWVHIVSVGVCIVFVAALPLIRMGLNGINTLVIDEYDVLMEQKSEEDLLIDIDEQA